MGRGPGPACLPEKKANKASNEKKMIPANGDIPYIRPNIT
jgi:hypothetical protein